MALEMVEAQGVEYRATLKALFARELRMDASRLDDESDLVAHGLDSMAGLVVAGEIEDTFGVTLEPTALWDKPSIAAIAAHLHELVLARAAVGMSQARGSDRARI